MLATLVVSSSAQANDRAQVRLDYQSDDAQHCPDEQSFRDIVAARLGYDPFESSAQRSIEARITRKGRGFSGSVALRGDDGIEQGSRTFEPPERDCNELATSMAVALSILLDPFGHAATPAPEAPPPPEPEPEPEPEPAPPPLTPPTEQPKPPVVRRELQLAVQGAMGVTFALTPGAALSPALAAGLAVNDWLVLVEGRVDVMPTDKQAHGSPVEASVYGAGPLACRGFGLGLACLGAELGAFQGRGVDVADSRTQTSFFASADARLGVRFSPSKHLSFRLLGELRAPLVRTSLSIDGKSVWNAPPLAFGLRLELLATFL